LSALRRRLTGITVTAACDVDNPLTGPAGAAAVYGPQKGASPSEVSILDRALVRWADLVAAATGEDRRNEPGAGAAGGVGFASSALLLADLTAGIDLLLEVVGFVDRIAGADLVVTGEGAIDGQTMRGKAPAGVLRAARKAGISVVAVCGQNHVDPAVLRSAGFDGAYALTDLEPDLAKCFDNGRDLLGCLGEQIARSHLPKAT
jgi:glycerate 2-kinase